MAMPRVSHTTRSLLLGIGMSDFNATLCLQTMMMVPHTTDIDMASVILITRHIQTYLNKLGANIRVSGAIDQDTDDILVRLCGAGYLTRPWYAIVEAVISANRRGVQVQRERADLGVPAQPLSEYTSSIFDSPSFLPAIPGGALTYFAGAAAILYSLTKKKR